MIVVEKSHLSDLKIYCAPFLFLRKLSLNPTTLTRLPNLPTEASCSLDLFHTIIQQQVSRRFHFSPTKYAECIPNLWTCPLRVQLPVTKTCQQPQTRLAESAVNRTAVVEVPK